MEDEFPHKKKKDSSTSRASKKSTHKHLYDENVIIKYKFLQSLGIAKRCVVCGKLKQEIFPTVKQENGYYRRLTNEEILEQYKKCPIVEI